MKKSILLIPFWIINLTAALSQSKLNIHYACSYYGEKNPTNVYTFTSDNDAQSALKMITDASGLSANFRLVAANVPNAAAVIFNNQRYILYNQTFMYNISQKINYWASISILAHEVGHHLNGHSLIPGGSRPGLELEADKFSGFILGRLGATLSEAQSAINNLISESGSLTHPGRSARLAAIANGWYQNTSNRNTLNASTSIQNLRPIDISGTNSLLPKLYYKKIKADIYTKYDLELSSNGYKFKDDEYTLILLKDLHRDYHDCKNPSVLILYMNQYQKYFYTTQYENDPINTNILLETKFETPAPYMQICGVCFSAGYYKGVRLKTTKKNGINGQTAYRNGVYGVENYYENNITLWNMEYADFRDASKMIPKPAFND